MSRNMNIFNMETDENVANPRLKYTIPGWTGVGFLIPRSRLDLCKDREDLKYSGVYFLVGKSDETGKNVVYVGKAGSRKNGEGVLNRLYEHKANPAKDYWVDAVALVTSDNSLGPTEIGYLENHFCNMAKEANRYEVKNGNDPTIGNLTEEKESDMEEFIKTSKRILNTAIPNIFNPLVSRSGSDPGQKMLYFERKLTKTGETVKAVGAQTDEGFVVLKGAVLSSQMDEGVSDTVKEKRKAVAVVDNVLQEDVLLSSPSGAAVFVCGKSTNGWEMWKDENGKTLKDLENMVSGS